MSMSPSNWLAWIPVWLPFDSNPFDCVLQGLVGACGISVFYNLMRVHLLLQSISSGSEYNGDSKDKGRSESSPAAGNKPLGGHGLSGVLQFWFLTGLLSLVGPRVSSLVVLEFSLRAVAAWITAGPDVLPGSTKLMLVQCQFSLGCALSCSLHFLQEGAPHRSLSLLLAAGLSWLLAGHCHFLWGHVSRLYHLHSSQRYCGVCITLLNSGHSLLPSLQRAVLLAFAVAGVAGLATVHHHFLSEAESLRFWTPLTICYTLLVVYVQEERNRCPGSEALLHTVALRLGALLVLMLMVGRWTDMLHILITFVGEFVCLLPSHDLLQALPQVEAEEDIPSRSAQHSSSTQQHMSPRRSLCSMSSDRDTQRDYQAAEYHNTDQSLFHSTSDREK
ncbi:transmembrane protein 82 isoform X1 [Oncorhynchus mykiss]|uniref:Transmembrane protein 82 n=2 Tax=Oncorhynchus mykiss TaxID=8022 RepID=A0A8C7UMJ4_ONCMY|nr:transmembrane protein 82 isoform X1 [Oncorhynchus mykiss]